MTNNEKSLYEENVKQGYELDKLRREYKELNDKYNAAKEIIKNYSKLI